MGESDRATQGWSLLWLTKVKLTWFNICKSRVNQAENAHATLSGWGARHAILQSDGQKKKMWDFFVLRSMIIPQRGIHHSDKGRDNISRAFKDGSTSIMRRYKKWVMLMSFCSPFTLRSFKRWLVQGQVQKNTSPRSHVKGGVVLKSLRGKLKRHYTSDRSGIGAAWWTKAEQWLKKSKWLCR